MRIPTGLGALRNPTMALCLFLLPYIFSEYNPDTGAPADGLIVLEPPETSLAVPTQADSSDTWKSLGPDTDPNRISALAVDPSTPSILYAGVSGYFGLYKTVDGGGTWNALAIPREFAFQSLAIDPAAPGTLYAGAFQKNNVYKSTDGGGTWVLTGGGLPACGYTCYGIFSLAINPQETETLYAGIFGEGVYKSTDSGGSWAAVGTGLPASAKVGDLVVDPMFPDVLYVGTWGDAVFKSVGGGGYWFQIRYGLTFAVDKIIYSLAVDPETTTTLYAGTEKNGVFKSSDGGKTWAARNKGLPENLKIIDLAIDPSAPAVVYAAAMDFDPQPGRSGVYKSTNGGEDWIYLGLDHTAISSLAIDPLTPSILYAGTDDGVYVIHQTAAS